MLNKQFKEHMNHLGEYDDALDLFLRQMNKMRDAPVTIDHLKAEMHHMLMATWAIHNPLCAAIIALKLFPEERNKLMKEITSVMKRHQNLDTNCLDEMEYMNCFINECRRLWPFGVGMFGRALQSFSIDGKIIPKGWYLLACFYATNINEEDWSNPLRFCPDRWRHGNYNFIKIK